MSTSEKIPVSKFLDQQSEGDRPGEMAPPNPRDTTATEMQKFAEKLEKIHNADRESRIKIEREIQQFANEKLAAVGVRMVPAQESGTILYRVKTCDVAGKTESDGFVLALNPYDAELKVLAHHKAKGATNTIYVVSIARVASTEKYGEPSELIL